MSVRARQHRAERRQCGDGGVKHLFLTYIVAKTEARTRTQAITYIARAREREKESEKVERKLSAEKITK